MVKVGCCGFPGGMRRYFKRFSLVEVQSTFYNLPRADTAKKWKSNAGENFEFTVKAWQAITHPPTSPTWRRGRVNVSPETVMHYGFFNSTNEVFEAWTRTQEICAILEANICVVQCPASFTATEENIRNMRSFFSRIDRNGLSIAWEPRGASWTHEKVRLLCEDLNLIHCVDPFAREPTAFSSNGIVYFRLHGCPPGWKMYNYQYTDEDLKWLKEKCEGLEAAGLKAYILFNNIYMEEDAERMIFLTRTGQI